MPGALRERVERALARLGPDIRSVARRLHRDPELSLEERRASALLCAFLRSQGFSVRRGVAGLPTSFVARRGPRRGVPRIAFLAEYDALPGIGHGCGHNLIGAAAAGAGAALAGALPDLRAEVVVVGTPAEETIGGKAVMVARGVFRGIDAALMFHPATENRVYTTSLACHSLEVAFIGRAAHAVAAPHRGINALEALIRVFVALKEMKPRLPPRARIPGVIIEGGRRANIVPDRAVGRFTLRARNRTELRMVERAFRGAVRGAAARTGAGAVIRALDRPYAEMRTNRVLARIFKRELGLLGRRTVDTPRTRMGSLDMGNVSQIVPAIHPYVAIAPPREALHSHAFARRAGGASGRAGLDVATRALALAGLEIARDPSILDAARREHRRGGRT